MYLSQLPFGKALVAVGILLLTVLYFEKIMELSEIIYLFFFLSLSNFQLY